MPLLEALSLKDNYIRFVPKTLNKLHYLRRLSLDDNLIEELELDGNQMPSLTSLSLTGNKLSALSPTFSTFSKYGEVVGFASYVTRLEILDLSNNQFWSLPNYLLLSLKSLKQLTAANNFLR